MRTDTGALLGRTPYALASRRRKLRIPALLTGRWTPREDKLLGTQPDREVARRLGRTVIACAARRRKLGLPSRGACKPCPGMYSGF